MVGSVHLGAAACMLFCLVGLASANVPISNPTTLTSLKTILGVTVSYLIDGQTVAGNTSCTSQVFGSACLPKLQAANSNYKVMINYNVLSNATLESTAHVLLKVCYDKTSTTDRAWRKANNVLVLDKQCAFTVTTTKTLPPTSGTATWMPPATAPNAGYFVRAYAICPNATYGTSPCGYGNSKGFFEVEQVNSRPTNLKGAVIGMCFAGPVFFFAYFGLDTLLTRRKASKMPR